VSLGVRLSRCHAVLLCVFAALVSAAMVMRCIQCSLVLILVTFQLARALWNVYVNFDISTLFLFSSYDLV